MKRKPATVNDMQKVVAAAKYKDKLLLMALSLNADIKGEQIRPGKETLSQRLGCSLKTVYNRMKKAVEAGMIEQTHEGHGEQNANVYRFCLENPAYPDEYKGMSLAAKNAVTRAAASNQPNAVTFEKNAVKSAKECGKNPAFLENNAVTPVTHHLTTTSQPPPQPHPQNGTLSLSLEEKAKPVDAIAEERAEANPPVVQFVDDVFEIVVGWYTAQEHTTPKGSMKAPKREMCQLARLHGRERFLAAVQAWLKAKPWLDFSTETKVTFSTLLGANFAKWLTLVDMTVKDAKSNAEAAADLARQIEASTEASKKIIERPSTAEVEERKRSRQETADMLARGEF
jgi:hypothetical protein